MPTRYRDRQTGSIVVEHVPGQSLLRWFYGTSVGHLVFRAFLNRPFCSRLYGWWKQSTWTRRQIRPFVERYHIDLDEIEYSPQPLFQLQRLLHSPPQTRS